MFRLAYLRCFSNVTFAAKDLAAPNVVKHFNAELPKASIYPITQAFAKAQLDFDHRITQIPVGKASLGLLGMIPVHSFGENVPLSRTAVIEVVSENELQITSLDYANTAGIEVAVKRTGIQADIQRDFKTLRIKLTGKLTEDLKTRLTELSKETQAELVSIRDNGLKYLRGRDEGQAQIVQQLYESSSAKIDALIKSKLQVS